MTEYLPRSAWGARPPAGTPTPLQRPAVDGTALHWPGMTVTIDAAGAEGARRVASALRGWQAYHMDVRGWSDIAYQVAVDQAGRAWILRGLAIRSAANGNADVNGRFGAILLVLGPGEQPSAAMKATTRAVVADFKAMFPGSRLQPYGHRDVRPGGDDDAPSTDCPGAAAYAAIQRGEFTPGIPGDDDVTDEQMQELKDHQREMCRIYAVANNEYTRQVLSTSTKAILTAISGVDEAVAAQLADDFASLSNRVLVQADVAAGHES